MSGGAARACLSSSAERNGEFFPTSSGQHLDQCCSSVFPVETCLASISPFRVGMMREKCLFFIFKGPPACPLMSFFLPPSLPPRRLKGLSRIPELQQVSFRRDLEALKRGGFWDGASQGRGKGRLSAGKRNEDDGGRQQFTPERLCATFVAHLPRVFA